MVPPCAIDVAPLVVEGGGHVVAEVAAEFRGEEPQQPTEESIGSGHVDAGTGMADGQVMLVWNSALRLAMASVLSSRAASARATSRPNAVSSYDRRRSSSRRAPDSRIKSVAQQALDDAVKRPGAEPD